MPYADPVKYREYQRKYQKEWNKRNREKRLETYRKHHKKNREKRLLYAKNKYTTQGRWVANLKSRFGITEEQYWEMATQQGNVCAICKQAPKGKLHVDHCHVTGKNRNLLCGPCNRAIGLFKENTEFLASAIEYIKKHKTLVAVA